jgi:phosphatidate cytidylyltransferase
MNQPDDEKQRKGPPVEGVRIIGAEEAQAAMESGAVAPRRSDDEPRYGDVPAAPSGPRPPLRFPLAGDEDPAGVPRSPVNPSTTPTPSASFAGGDLPHWTEPPTGENPRILLNDDEDDDDDWAPPSSGPRWREEGPSDWDDVDDHDPTEWADDETPMGALDQERSGESDLFSFDEDEFESDEVEDDILPARTRTRTRPPAPSGTGAAASSGGGRDVGTAITTGVIVAAAFLLDLKVFKRAGGAAFVTIVLSLAAAEMFGAFRQRGFRPATLLGVVGTAALSIAAYRRGEQAFPLVMSLFVMFSLLWYLVGVVRSQPVVNIGTSLLGFAYVGFLGAHASLLLRFEDGVGMLLGAIIATVGYDVLGFFVGSRIGRTPLASASPNKTVEGLFGGMVGAVTAAFIVLGVVGLHPWDGGSALALGMVVAVTAPLGDLCESLLKRDLGIKDMGSILPGHGGVLDRIDAMLFVIPATYYLVKLLELYTH